MMTSYSKCGKVFSQQEIEEITTIVKEHYQEGRCEISRKVCKALSWYSENGKMKDWICREFLLKLQKDNLIILPPPKACSFTRFRKKKLDKVVFDEPDRVFEGNLGDFSRPVFKRVGSSSENTLWEYLVWKYHYLGYKGVMGRFLKYLIYMEDIPVGCIGFTGAALRVSDRDSWIGWDDEVRRKNLKHVANNFRFVLFPWVRVKYLASHILSKAIPLLAEDWQRQYNVAIYLVETFIEQERFQGTCYKASNWKHVGQSRGYAKTKKAYRCHGIIKDVYVYPTMSNSLELLQCL
ncbi:MAG: hypothetical protein A2Y62_03465 [Candidatus Fischerbacteria bacterium RBG_13_37_8]|uniref:Uncharacterized protein n=1 Tax=Candidatus Fischerbacteria bacterium RBG_13_37_8 TaxID=1817863 RepID=A0A1F5VK65_9BACT|nr:MAG: hypothetical protein A2Y62_03465 [Candidatus Fischerbacteria bacterium RBG_13_37_8]